MTDSPVTHQLRGDLSIDQQLALKSAATRLESEFADTFGTETIERFLCSSYDHSPAAPPFPTSCPAGRNDSPASASTPSRGLKATSTTANRPCCSSARTTPAAPKWPWGSSPTTPATRRSPGRAGPEPGNEINPAAIEAMREVGIDITGEYPKPWTDEIVQAADVVITMGCGDACPIFPENATRTGNSRIPPAKASTPYARSATTSTNASADYWPT